MNIKETVRSLFVLLLITSLYVIVYLMTERNPHNAWHKRARRSIITGRQQGWYDRVFDIQPDERVLDLGSGRSPYADENITRLDYLYRKETPGVGKNVAAIFQELPFPDKTFDRAVASWSLVKLQEGAHQGLEEALRVIKPGGELQIFPVRVKRAHAVSSLKGQDLTKTTVVEDPAFTNLRRSYLPGGPVGMVMGLLGVTSWDSDLALGVYADATSAMDLGVSTSEFLQSTFWPASVLTISRTEEMSDPQARAIFVSSLLESYRIVKNSSLDLPVEDRLRIIKPMVQVQPLEMPGPNVESPPFNWAEYPDL